MRALAPLTFALLATTLGIDGARACGHGQSYGLSGGDAVVIALGTAVATDAIFVGYDVLHGAPDHSPSAPWAKGETYVAVPQLVIGASLLGVIKPPDLPVLLAFTTLPVALSAHGFYATNGEWGARWQIPVSIVAAFDVALTGYDLGVAFRGVRPDDVYAMGELVAAAPQVLFGLSVASSFGGRTAAPALLATALPAFMLAHAIVLLETHPAPAENSAPAAKTSTAWSAARISIAPLMLPSTFGVGARGVF